MMKRYFLIIYLLLSIPLYGSSFSKRFCEKSHEPWGCDKELLAKTHPENEIPNCSLPSKVCQSMIRFFQVYISPIDGPRSSFIPTSSQYTLLAIRKYGPLKGIALGCDRLMRENEDLWVYRTVTHENSQRKVDLPP